MLNVLANPIPLTLSTTAMVLSLAVSASTQDLAPTALNSSTKVVKPGQQIRVSSTIKNWGLLFGTGKSVQSAYYLSDSLILIPRLATLLGTFTTPPLGAGKEANHSMNVTIPKSIKSKTYYLFVQADRKNELKETNELNNTRFRAVTGTATDLIVSLIAPGPLTAGSTIEVSVDVTNTGTLKSGATTALLFLSKDPIIDTSDVFVGKVNVPEVPGRSHVKIKRNILVLYCHSYYTLLGQTSLGVIVNPAGANRVLECAYNNNTSFLLRLVKPSTANARVLEWRPTFREDGLGPTSVSSATFKLPNEAAKGRMCITAPNDRLAGYVLLWSASPTGFQWDAFSGFTLGLVNSVLFDRWLGYLLLDGSRNDITFFLPKMPVSGLRLYTYHYYFALKNSGFGARPVRSDFIK